MVLSSAANNRAARPSPTKNNAPVLSNGIKAVSASSSSSLGEQRDTKRAKDITELQRRLSHLTNAIDDTLQRGGGEKRAAASPAPMRPPSSPSTPALVVEADSRKASAVPPAPSTTIDTIPTTRVFSLVSRSTSSASTTNYSRGASATAQQQHNNINVSQAASTETNARPRSPQQRRRLMSPDLIHSSGRGEMAPLVALSAPVTMASIASHHHHHDHVDPVLDDEPVQLARTAKPQHSNNNPPPPRTQLVLEDPLPALRDEESDIRLRIAALKRIEAEKMELIAHQKRLIELDNERHRLEDERRRGRSSRGRSGSLVSSAASPAAGAMLSLSPQPQRSVHHNNEAFGTDDEVDREMIAVDHQELRSTHQLTTTTVRAVTPPRSVTAPSSSTGAGASSSLSSVFRYHTSRSPSPILRFQSASPSSQAREESTHRVLRNAIAASSNHGGGGLLNDSGQHLPSTTSGGGPRWIPTAKGDQRFVCRELLVERGIDAKVLTGHDRAIPCKVHLSPNHQELLALPVDETGGLMTESHHFPLRGAALLYPNGVIQHTWIPRRVHVSGVVVGNRAKSVLLAKGCPHFISNARENRPRLYLVVGGDAYSDEATLLVLQFGSRLEWLCVLLGLHGAMWPDGKPPLTPGRALWLYACHAVTQLQWEANTTSDNLWHQSRRRSRSADPHQGLSRNNTPHQPQPQPQQQQQQPQQALFHRSSTPPPQPRGESSSTPMNTSHRFAVPPTPSASISPLRPTTVSSGATHHPLQHVTLSSNTSDARSTLAAPSQLSRVYPSSANRPLVGLQATQMMIQQQQQQPSQRAPGVGRGPNPAAAPLATLPNGFVLVGSSSSNASSFQQPHRTVSQQQQQQQQPQSQPLHRQQQQQPSVSGSAPRSTFFPKSLSRQSGGRQSVLQYGY